MCDSSLTRGLSVTKPQYVDQIPRSIKVPTMTVEKMFDRQTELDNREQLEYFLSPGTSACESMKRRQ